MIEKLLFSNKLMLWNLIGLVVVKLLIWAPVFWFTAAIGDPQIFPKEDIISETNALRTSLGVPPLRLNETLTIAAQQKLQDMIANQYFAHISPAQVSPWHWFSVNKYDYTYAGENLALGFYDAKSTLQAWTDSPTHRKNLVNSNYQEIGVAVGLATIKEAKGIVVVQLFGTQRGGLATAPPQPVPQTNGISIGFGQTQAQEETIAIPTPVFVSATPSLAQSTSTDAPISVATTITKQNVRASDLVNTVFLWYTLVVALGAGAFVVIRRKTIEHAAQMAFHAAIFIIAVLFPVFTFIAQAFIL